MLARTVVAVTLATLSAVAPTSTQSKPDDAAVIDVALTAASLTHLTEFFKGAPTPPLLLRSQTAAVCDANPKPGTFCIDFYVKILREQLQKKPNDWPVTFYDAVIEQNLTSRDLSGMTFASAKLTAPDNITAFKTGQAIAQVSQPTYLDNRAIVFVSTSYAWSITHAVLMEKRGGRWEPIAVASLGRS